MLNILKLPKYQCLPQYSQKEIFETLPLIGGHTNGTPSQIEPIGRKADATPSWASLSQLMQLRVTVERVRRGGSTDWTALATTIGSSYHSGDCLLSTKQSPLC